MKRREFIVLLSAASAAWPAVATAQRTGKLHRIGFLAGGARPTPIEGTVYEGFLQGMRQLGYVEGKDFTVEWRFAEGEYERFPQLAADLVRLNVDVIVLGAMAAVRPTQQITRTIPIVMGNSIDPVGNGVVVSLARPGGNTTGLSSAYEDYIPKLLELLQMTVPQLSKFAILINPASEIHLGILRLLEHAERARRQL
jgi:putative ABC transport system substrate-binding protein